MSLRLEGKALAFIKSLEDYRLDLLRNVFKKKKNHISMTRYK